VTAADADKALLQAVACGDRRALRELYTSYHGRLFRFLMRVTHDTGLSEEILNDTMWVVWRNAASFRDESRVSTWITGIAYRRALKSLASRRRQVPLSGRMLDEMDEADSQTALAITPVDQIETREWIDVAMAQLSPEHRLTLELAYFMGETCEDIAQIAGCPVGTVKTRLHHARMHMRRHLAQAGSRQRGDEAESI
jgi:RNA polymerase sigma-70 factor, ECF subfamily